MLYNPMRSTPQDRWLVKKYKGNPLDYGDHDLRDFVPLNCWLILTSKPNEVQIRCEQCGHFMQVSIEKKRSYDKHTVDDNGIVTPSIGHPSCGFHEWGVLEDF